MWSLLKTHKIAASAVDQAEYWQSEVERIEEELLPLLSAILKECDSFYTEQVQLVLKGSSPLDGANRVSRIHKHTIEALRVIGEGP